MNKFWLAKEVPNPTHIELAINRGNPKVVRQLYQAINRATNRLISTMAVAAYPRFKRTGCTLHSWQLRLVGLLSNLINIVAVAFIGRDTPSTGVWVRTIAKLL